MELAKFSRANCVPCQMLTQYLNDKGVQYTERQVDEIGMYGLNVMGVPVLLLVDDNDAPLDFVVGFNPSNTSEIDNLISKL